MKFTNNPNYKENIMLKLTFEFAVAIVLFSEKLDGLRKYTISKQILRSGTSIGANVKESQNAESKADFIHKLKIAMKEADELEYWLYICESVESYPSANELKEKLIEIKKLFKFYPSVLLCVFFRHTLAVFRHVAKAMCLKIPAFNEKIHYKIFQKQILNSF